MTPRLALDRPIEGSAVGDAGELIERRGFGELPVLGVPAIFPLLLLGDIPDSCDVTTHALGNRVQVPDDGRLHPTMAAALLQSAVLKCLLELPLFQLPDSKLECLPFFRMDHIQ